MTYCILAYYLSREKGFILEEFDLACETLVCTSTCFGIDQRGHALESTYSVCVCVCVWKVPGDWLEAFQRASAQERTALMLSKRIAEVGFSVDGKSG